MRRSRYGAMGKIGICAIVLGTIIGCGGGDESVIDAGPVSFASDIKPIFDRKCISCHHPGSAIEVDLTDPFDPDLGIIRRPNTWVPAGSQQALIVDPGNVEGSFLIKKVTEESLSHAVDGDPMPMSIARLTAEELGAVEQWIRDGAQNDAFFAQSVAPIFGTEITLRSASGKCTWCHYPGSPTGLDVLNPFDPVEGMVGRESVYGGLIVDPGNVEGSFLVEKLAQLQPAGGNPMPYHPPRLTSEEIALLRAWVAQGALDN